MGRAVFTNSDGVVRKYVDVWQTRKCAESNRSAAIVSKNHKRRAGRAKHSMIRNAVQDRAHAVLANSEANIATTWTIAGEIATILDVIQGRSMQIGAAADEQRHGLYDPLQRFTPRFTRSQ